MFGDKKTLGDVWDSAAADDGAGPSDGEGDSMGAGPAQMKMERLAKALGIEDLGKFTELIKLVVENNC